MPAPTIVGTAVVTGTAGPSLTITRPAVQAGDWVIIAARNQAATSTQPDFTLPAGWVRLNVLYTSGPNRILGFYGKRITDAAAEPSTYALGLAGGGRSVVILLVVRGAAAVGGYSTPYDAGLNNASYTVNRNGTEPGLALYALAAEFTSGNNHTPTSHPGTLVTSGVSPNATLTQSRTGLTVSSAPITTTSVPAASATFPGATVSPNLQGLYLQGAPEPVTPDPTPVGLPVTLQSGAGRLYVKTSTGYATPSQVKYIPPGYRNVAHMLAGEFWWAHRGGSASFPEHSLHAYTQSALRGYGALEISMNRTSDGVWIGLHDATLDRTSGVTGVDPTALTWAQVQAYQITLGPGPARPYMRLEELAEAYGGTHIIVVDPKYRHSDRRAEFFAKLRELFVPDRLVVKFAYDAVSLAQMARANGMASWGYGYASNITNDPQFTARMAEWDIVGMEYGAPQSAWDTVLSVGRPAVAHICPNQAAVDTGRARGAQGFQCAATAAIAPLR